MIKMKMKEQLDQQIKEKELIRQKERVFLNQKELATSKNLLMQIGPEFVNKDKARDVARLDNNLGNEIDRLNRLIHI